MIDHFAYLYEDDNRDFFQKTACELVDSGTPSADEQLVKVAASRPGHINTFEKVASRVEQDLFIIKTAGESGFNLGAIRRGMGHFDNLLDRADMDAEQAVEMFDKIAAETILHDLSVARDALYKLGGDEHRDWVDAELAAIGVELVKAAQLDKEALIGLGRLWKAVSRGQKATKGLGVAARTRALVSSPGRAWRGHRAQRAALGRTKAKARLGKAQKKLKGVKAKQLARVEKAKGISGAGVRAAVTPGVQARATKAIGKETAAVAGRSKELSAASTALSKRRNLAAGRPAGGNAPAVGGKAPAKQQAAKTEARQGTDDLARQRAADKAGGAATPKKKPKKKKADEPKASESAAADTAGEGVGFVDTAAKLRDKGWSALSSAERQKLINVGAVTVIGGRVVLGKGLITGGEGLI